MSALNDSKSKMLTGEGYVGAINEKEKQFYENYKPATNPPYQAEVDMEQRVIDQLLYTEQDLYSVLVTLIIDLKARGIIN